MAPENFKELQDQIRDYADTELNGKIARAVGEVLGKHRTIDLDKARDLFLEALLWLFGCNDGPRDGQDRLIAEFEEGWERGCSSR